MFSPAGGSIMSESKTADLPLLEVRDLVRHFRLRGKSLFSKPSVVRAVDGISFQLRTGETLGIVGESGCGKSTMGRLALGMDDPTSGDVRFEGRSFNDHSIQAWRKDRCDMQMIFQDAYGALDPRMSVARQIREPLDIHRIGSIADRDEQVDETLDAVGLSRVVRERFPHELSGGQQQRVVIARALVLRPKLIVCDEPISALDVSVQAQVVNLLAKLQEQFQLAYLFISHDLGIVRHICERVAVMYLGKIVETADCRTLFDKPLHPYSRALISAIPIPDPDIQPDRLILEGDPPSPVDVPSGCRFHTRCPFAEAKCRDEEPQLRLVEDGRHTACHFAERWMS
jgi:oligopeptide/dipeptide ABC transporter ATP-binding protein